MNTNHISEFSEVKKKEQELNASKIKKRASQIRKPSSRSVNILSFMIQPTSYTNNSREKLHRDQALSKMIIEKGVLMALVGKAAFQRFCKVLDPKYSISGKLFFYNLLISTLKYMRILLKYLKSLQIKITMAIVIKFFTKVL